GGDQLALLEQAGLVLPMNRADFGDLGLVLRVLDDGGEFHDHTSKPTSGDSCAYWDCSRTLYSSFQRCLPSRLIHHSSSVPTSVTLLCRCTGTVLPCLPGASSSVATDASSSICPSHSSTTVPTASARRTVEPRKRNSAGSPTTRPNS